MLVLCNGGPATYEQEISALEGKKWSWRSNYDMNTNLNDNDGVRATSRSSDLT